MLATVTSPGEPVSGSIPADVFIIGLAVFLGVMALILHWKSKNEERRCENVGTESHRPSGASKKGSGDSK